MAVRDNLRKNTSKIKSLRLPYVCYVTPGTGTPYGRMQIDITDFGFKKLTFSSNAFGQVYGTIDGTESLLFNGTAHEQEINIIGYTSIRFYMYVGTTGYFNDVVFE